MKILTLLLLLSLPLTALTATKVTVGGIVVTGQPVFDHEVYHGYSEYRFQVANHSDREHRVEVQLNTRNYQQMSKTVVAPAGGRLKFSMFANRLKGNHRLHVIVDSREEKSTRLSEVNASYPSSTRATSLLLSKSMNQDDVRKRIEANQGLTEKQFNNLFGLRRTDLSSAEWSENWLAYSSFDGVVLKASEFSDLTPNAQTALRHYVEAGGALSIAGAEELPFSGAAIRELGSSNSNRSVYAVGFGQCVIYPTETPPASVWLRRETRLWRETAGAFKLNKRANSTNGRLSVVDQISIPVRGFLLLITLFALIAGPLTVFLLAKTNRRIWLLWVIPLESAVACGIVLAYSFFSEGITPTVRTRAFTLLDQEQHAATTLGWLGYYCPQRPAKGLFFPEDLELNWVNQNPWNSGSRSIDWTRGLHFENGWVEARVPTFFMTRRNATRRERLEFSTEPDGQLHVVNGLGAEVEELWYRDFDGAYHQAKQLKAGQKGRVNGPMDPPLHQKPIRDLFTENYGKNTFPDTKSLTAYLEPGTYVAILNGAPFMDHGLGDKKIHLRTESLVYGVLPKEVRK